MTHPQASLAARCCASPLKGATPVGGPSPSTASAGLACSAAGGAVQQRDELECGTAGAPPAGVGRAQRWPVLSRHPLWPCREAQGVGRAWAAQHVQASCTDSLRLSERRERSEHSEFRSAAPRPSITGCPQRSEGTRPAGSPFFGSFLWQSKERDCAAGRTSRPAAHPPFTTSKNKPNRPLAGAQSSRKAIKLKAIKACR